jgi:hypothetical protein
MSIECIQEAATTTPAEATLPAPLWVRLKDTRINLSNVNYVEDAEYWLAVYFRLDCDAHLWQPAKRREHGERLILFGQEARELRGLLECVSLSLTPPVPPKPPEEW